MVRVLRELRTEDVIRKSRAGIVLVRPEELVLEVFPAQGAGDDPAEWNLGS